MEFATPVKRNMLVTKRLVSHLRWNLFDVRLVGVLRRLHPPEINGTNWGDNRSCYNDFNIFINTANS